MKIRFVSFYSKIISFFLVLLGFSSCDSDGGGGGGSIAEYGVPTAKFKVKGTLVDKTDSSVSISGVKVAIGQLYRDGTGQRTFYVDSIVTNNTGGFDLGVTDFPMSQKFVIKYEDTDKNKNYGLVIDTVRFDNPSFTGGSGGWYAGEATKDLGKVKLQSVPDKK